jgi:hypothetical protein
MRGCGTSEKTRSLKRTRARASENAAIPARKTCSAASGNRKAVRTTHPSVGGPQAARRPTAPFRLTLAVPPPQPRPQPCSRPVCHDASPPTVIEGNQPPHRIGSGEQRWQAEDHVEGRRRRRAPNARPPRRCPSCTAYRRPRSSTPRSEANWPSEGAWSNPTTRTGPVRSANTAGRPEDRDR